ncbi:prealbumin-like fold domain-containing protein [Agromyces sp. GXS1127]|uniref:prealbumin-like fold domain-containing protein n=1 Tax=Agromyces sp. GXS1127 TaxID=3424181 RepID=UPI003D318659
MTFRRRCLRIAAAAGIAGLVGTAFLAGPAIAAAPLSLPDSNFEIEADANLTQDAAAPSIDWKTAGLDVKVQQDEPTGQTDNSFGQGAKEDISNPTVVAGSIPNNKSDLKYFGVLREKTATKDFVHLFWTRVQEPNGTTNMDFEFNQSPTIDQNGVTPVRTEGDLLIQYDLSRGGTSPTLWVAFWLTDANFDPPYRTEAASTADCVASNSFPCWGKRINLTAASLASGSINTSNISAANSAFGIGALSPRTFGEASIDFTALLGTAGCTSFGSAYLKSRSSDAFNSEIKDFIKPEAVNISNCGTVIIRKQTDPDGATTLFDYTKTFATAPATGNTFQLADNGTKTYNNVLFGTGLKVTEGAVPAGWKFDRVDCSASTGVTPSISGSEVTFALDSSTDVLDCTYYNETGGTVIIHKVTDPDPDTSDADFGFTTDLDRLSGANDPSFSLKNGGEQSYTDVLIGTGYTIDESTVPPGWDLESIDCSASSGVTPVVDVDEGTVTFAIDDADDILDCTYGNETGGTVIIHKVTQPASDTTTSFDYSTSFDRLAGVNDPTLDDPAFSLKNTEQQTYADVLFGTGLTVTEDSPLPSGWELVSVNCDASSGVTPQIVGATVTFDIDDADDKLECTYTNRASGSITIEKITDSGTGSFEFTSGTLTPSPFTLTTTAAGAAGADSETFSDLDPGTYDAAETVPDYWNLVSATCDDGSDPASIGLSAGEEITCTFHNEREVGAIEITKLRKHAADGLGENHPHEGVDFVITGGELPPEGVTVTTDENGVACATGLLVSGLAGLYTITETVPDGYAPVGTQTANVTEAADCADANAGAVKEFVNTPLTNITVSVDSQVPGGTYSSIECDVDGSDTVAIADAMDDASITIEDLEPRTVVCTIVIDP